MHGLATGIAVVALDHDTGKMSHKLQVDGGVNPTFLCTDKEKRFLYATNEHYDVDSQILSFAIHPDGTLTAAGTASARGGAACFDLVDPSGAFLLSANYQTGSVVALRRGADGVLQEPATCFVEFPLGEATGVVADRQERPHAHHIVFHPRVPGLVFVKKYQKIKNQ